MSKGAKKADDKQKPAKKKPTDWQAVERDFRTGRFTLRELAEKHGANHATIGRRAKRGEWPQDLADAVRQATNAALMRDTVRQVQQECDAARQGAAESILAAAEVNRQVISGHRGYIKEATGLVTGLIAELRAIGSAQEDLERLAEIAGGEDPSKALEAVRKVTSVHARASSAKTLADAVDKLMRAERVAYGLDKGDDEPPGGKPAGGGVLYMDDDRLIAIASGGSR